MTKSEIASRVRENLNDNNITFYSINDINDAIQDAYEEVAVYCECIEKDITLDFKNDTIIYDFTSLIPDYYRVIRIYSYAISQYLVLDTERKNLNYGTNWMLMSGSARSFSIKGPKYISIIKKQSNAVGSFKVWYKAQANILSDNDTPIINSKFQILLEHYATADLLEQNQEFTKASSYWATYDEMLEDYRYKLQLLAKADRLFVR